MIERMGNARGLRFPIWPGCQVEFWFVPRGTVIPLHSHRTMDGWICNLWGRVNWFSQSKGWDVWGPFRLDWASGELGFAQHRVPAGYVHGAEVLGAFAVFMNVERCHNARVSASKDFITVK